MHDVIPFVALLVGGQYLFGEVISEEQEAFVLMNVCRIELTPEGPRRVEDRFFSSDRPSYLRKQQVVMWRPVDLDSEYEIFQSK